MEMRAAYEFSGLSCEADEGGLSPDEVGPHGGELGLQSGLPGTASLELPGETTDRGHGIGIGCGLSHGDPPSIRPCTLPCNEGGTQGKTAGREPVVQLMSGLVRHRVLLVSSGPL